MASIPSDALVGIPLGILADISWLLGFVQTTTDEHAGAKACADRIDAALTTAIDLGAVCPDR